nr:hypothetical protein [Tanacetum cinerariifolium]
DSYPHLEEQDRFGRTKSSLRIYEAEVKSSFFAITYTQNIAFVSSQTTDKTNEPVSVVTSVFAASAKNIVFALPNVDTLSNAIIYPFFTSQSNSPHLDNADIKEIDADDLKEVDLKWQMAMLSVRAMRFLQRTRRNLRANGPTSMGFDMSKEECCNYHRKGHFARECRSLEDTRRNVTAEHQRRNVLVETSTSNALVLQCDGVDSYDWSFQAEEEPTNYSLMAFTSSSSSSSDNEVAFVPNLVLKLMLHCNLTMLRTFMPPKPELVFHDAPNVNETLHTAFNVELSPTKSDKDLSHTHRPSASIIKDLVSNLEHDSEAELPQNAPSFVQPTEQVKTPRPLVKTVEHSILAANNKTDISKPKSYRNNRNRKACCVSILTRSKLVLLTAARRVTTVVSPNDVTRPRPAKTIVTKTHSPPRRTINRRPSPPASNFHLKVTVAKASMVNDVNSA